MSETTTLEVRVAAKSDTGLKRKENQDRMTRFYSPFGEVFLVTDGMGGHRGGAKAAGMVGDGFTKHLRALPPDTPVQLAIRMAAEKTNSEIVQESRSGNEETAGMGATMVLAILRGNDAVIAHVGDSRAYLYRDGNLRALTRDHTRGQEKMDQGLMTEEEAWDHPDSSVLTRAFGHSDPLIVEISEPLPLQSADRIILCSDGLCGYVRDRPIAEVLSHGLDAKRTAEKLVRLANEAGGEDNITVQVILVGPDESPDLKSGPTQLEQGWKSPPRGSGESGFIGRAVPRSPKFWVLLAVLALALFAAAGWGVLKFMHWNATGPRSQLIAAATRPKEQPGVQPAPPVSPPAKSTMEGADKPAVVLIGDDHVHDVARLLEKLKVAAKKVPLRSTHKFPEQNGVLMRQNVQAAAPLAMKIHSALVGPFTPSLVTLRYMNSEEEQIEPKSNVLVVVHGGKD